MLIELREMQNFGFSEKRHSVFIQSVAKNVP